LIGRGGQNKNAIKEETGCQVRVEANTIPPVVLLSGTPQEVHLAMEEIAALGITLQVRS